MKQFLIFMTILFAFISCNQNDKKISQAEFEHLVARDSIESIHLNSNEKQAKIQIKSFNKKNISYVLPIASVESFEASLNHLKNTLHAQNIYPNYSMSIVSGSAIPFYLTLISPLFFICTFLLFLIAVIDLLKSRFETPTDKLIWLLVVFLVPIIGPILYSTIGIKQKIAKNRG